MDGYNTLDAEGTFGLCAFKKIISNESHQRLDECTFCRRSTPCTHIIQTHASSVWGNSEFELELWIFLTKGWKRILLTYISVNRARSLRFLGSRSPVGSTCAGLRENVLLVCFPDTDHCVTTHINKTLSLQGEIHQEKSNIRSLNVRSEDVKHCKIRQKCDLCVPGSYWDSPWTHTLSCCRTRLHCHPEQPHGPGPLQTPPLWRNAESRWLPLPGEDT